MLNSILKIKSKYTGLLIRMDDIAENMNWKYMDRCELLFDKFNLKPLLGVIPENKDPEFLKYSKNSDFWSRVKSWERKGWEISMHGYTHIYQQETKKKDIFNYGGRSEFYGLDYQSQLSKIELGLKKFKEKNISVKSFFAPNHTYDLNTLKALKECNIKIIIDGYGLFPYYKFDLLFIPQLFYKEILLPFGIQSTSMHINYWDKKYLQNFENFIYKNHSKIIDIDYILNLSEPNFFKNGVNYSVEKALKVIRNFR
jgi:predicted deacetylase|tara:strand:+ start:529 stop:1293 length:765 start_codon:yes stop_codon:yes gene_type:complete